MAVPALELRIPETQPRRLSPYVARVRMAADEFIAWDHGNRLADWVDGEAYVYMTTTNEHERILQFCGGLLTPLCNVTGLGIVRRGPFAMRLPARGRIREPDMLVLLSAHLDRLTDALLEGPADLVIEVISEDSVSRDRRAKYREYEEGGVGEYWVIDSRPRRHKAAFYRRGPGGPFEEVTPAEDGRLHSTVLPEFWIRPEWLWDTTVNPLKCLAEIIGLERILAAMA